MLHQKQGVVFLYERNRAILADEAGLGKTRQVLEAAKLLIKTAKLLVICPTSIVPNWYAEAKKWGFPENKIVCVGLEHAFLKNYKELKKGSWGIIVLDESHNFRRLEAQRTRAFLDLIKKRECKIWFLTGTPIVKGAMDLFVPLSVCKPGVHGKYKDFISMYCHTKHNKWVPGGVEHFGVKNTALLKPFIDEVTLRRYKKNVVEDMPYKLISRIPLEIEARNFLAYNDPKLLRAITKHAENAGGGKLDEDVAETIQELALKKVKYVVDFIKDTLLEHPLVIFAHHRAVIYDLADSMRELDKTVEIVVGSMDKAVKFKHIQDFQAGKIDVLVVGILAGGIGHNLHRASRCVFAEFPWTWAALEQATDRLHRIGQKDCVNAYHCFAKDTFEERQLDIIESRKGYTKELFGLE